MAEEIGRVLAGSEDAIRRAYEQFQAIPVDMDLSNETPDPFEKKQTTIARETSVTGTGTFLGKARRTLRFLPASASGWWFERTDLPDNLPIKSSVYNVWTTNRNIVLCSGSPHNYMRMVEHIVALRPGMGIDNLLIKVDSGDPPLFNRGSMDIVESLEQAGIALQDNPPVLLTVREPVSMAGPNGSMLVFLPAARGVRHLTIDCAIDFPNAIGRQRVKFVLNRKVFRHGALARTNTTSGMKLYSHTIGKLFADVRNLGYTDENILIAGKKRYLNEPRMMHEGKSLEAVWHRAVLDLLAALALLDEGRLAGTVLSFKAGHNLDVIMCRRLVKESILVSA